MTAIPDVAACGASAQPASGPLLPTATGDAVKVHGLTKTYGSRRAVDGLGFRVPLGSVTGLVGPNGAGKTTVMAMLLGLVRPSAGDGAVLGAPMGRPEQFLPRVGALIETPAFHPGASGIDNLRALSVLGRHGASREDLDRLLNLVGLTGRGGDRAGSYSLGMKQRLGIAAALLGDPELVILDEPTNGLDPMGMQDMRRLIRAIAGQGRTVIVSSHLLAELEQVCDWLVVIDRGGLVYEGAPGALPGPADRLGVRAERPQDQDRLAGLAAEIGLRADGVANGAEFVLPRDADRHELAAALNRRAHSAGIVLTQIQHITADLESRYLTLVDSKGAQR